MLEATIKCKPHSVWLAVGDFKPFIKPLRDAGTQHHMGIHPGLAFDEQLSDQASI